MLLTVLACVFRVPFLKAARILFPILRRITDLRNYRQQALTDAENESMKDLRRQLNLEAEFDIQQFTHRHLITVYRSVLLLKARIEVIELQRQNVRPQNDRAPAESRQNNIRGNRRRSGTNFRNRISQPRVVQITEGSETEM